MCFKIRSRRRPTLPGTCVPSTIGAGELNCCVRNGNRWGLSAIITRKLLSFCQNPALCFKAVKHSRFLTWILLSCAWYRLSWARYAGSFFISLLDEHCPERTFLLSVLFFENYTVSVMLRFIFRSSPRPISTGQLLALLPFHTRPIYQFVFLVSYSLKGWEILSWGRLRA